MFYYYFYGKDKVLGKLEFGNLNYEFVYVICGVVDYLVVFGEKVGEMGSVCEKIEVVFVVIIVQENVLVEWLLSYLRLCNDCQIVGQLVNCDGLCVLIVFF